MGHDHPECSIGRKSQPPHYGFETQKYEIFQVIFVSEGGLFFRSDGNLTALRPGHIALLRRESAFKLWTERFGYRGIYFSVSDPHTKEFAGPSCAFKSTAAIRALFGMIEREVSRPGAHSFALLHALGWAVAWLTIRSFSERPGVTSEADYSRAIVDSARQAIHMAICTGQPPREVLQSFEISYRQLSRYFQRELKKSPKQYQLESRIREGCRLLTNSDLKITEIAYELGYSSSQHFATQFAKLMRRSPQAFRQDPVRHGSQRINDKTMERS